MHDLVSYNQKHNEANGDSNKDGESNNLSWNCGAEGPTDDVEINRLRRQQVRNFFATLLLSQGVPMIRHGDEFGHTQKGNNNAYCQDNEISWLNWQHDDEQKHLLHFVSQVIQLKRNEPVFRRPKFFQGRPLRGQGVQDIYWREPSGQEMTEEAWNSGTVGCVGVHLAGDAIADIDERGEQLRGDTMLRAVEPGAYRSRIHAADAQAGRILGTRLRHVGAPAARNGPSRRRDVHARWPHDRAISNPQESDGQSASADLAGEFFRSGILIHSTTTVDPTGGTLPPAGSWSPHQR